MKHPPALSRIVATAVLPLVLSGCTTTGLRGPVRLETPFWQRTTASVLVVVTDPPTGGIYRKIGDGLYDTVRPEPGDAEMLDFLERYHRSLTSAGAEKLFSSLFEDRGFTVSFGKIHQTDGDQTLRTIWRERAFEKLREELPNQKLVLVISTLRWGVTRESGGILAIGSHPAFVELRGELLDLSNEVVFWSDEVLGSANISNARNGSSVQRSTRAALEDARTEAERKLAAKLRSWKGTIAQSGHWRTKAH